MYKIFEETQFIGKEVIFLPNCRSTNDIATEMYSQGLIEEGGIIITDHQFSGRGQRGNSWDSNPKENLTFSIILKTDFLRPIDSFNLNVFTSVALVNALHQITSHKFRIKWPNDIMYNDRKLGGILIENNIHSDEIRYTTVGIGLNVNQTEFVTSIKATSMKLILNMNFNLNDIFNKIVFHMEETYLRLKSFDDISLKETYLTNLYWLNEEHTFESSVKFRGTIIGIDQYGRLKVRSLGKIKTFNFKEITYLA